MGQVSYDAPRPGDVRSIAPFEAGFNALVSRSTTLQSDNLAEQGLDKRHFGYAPGSLLFEVDETTREDTALGNTANVWQTTGLQFPAASPTLFRTGAFSVSAGDRLLIRARVHLTSSLALGTGLPASGQFEIRLGYKLAAAAQTFWASTRRRMAMMTNIVGHGTLKTMYLVDGPLNFDWVQIEWRSAVAANYYPEVGLLTGQRYQRAS